MISNKKPQPKEKKTNDTIVVILGGILIISSIVFTVLGIFNIFRALLTERNLKELDIVYFTSGMLLLFSIAIVNTLSEIKEQNKEMSKGIVNLLNAKINTPPNPMNPINDVLKNLFNKPPGINPDGVTGSISVFDANNPNNPIFQGDFKNADEMNEMRKNLIDKMLNSKKDFNGKKMTKQEMLNQLNVNQLKDELKIAVEAEDWLWAASLRDKIAEKDIKKNNGNTDSEKKDNLES